MTYERLDNFRDDMDNLDGRLENIGKQIDDCMEKLKAIEAVSEALSDEVSESVEQKRNEIDETLTQGKENAAEIVVELGVLEAELEDVVETNERDREALQSLAGANIDVAQLQGDCDYRRTRIEAYKESISELSSKALLLAGLRGGEPPENSPF